MSHSAHARMHAYTHTRASTHMCTRTHTHACTHTYAHMHSCAHTRFPVLTLPHVLPPSARSPLSPQQLLPWFGLFQVCPGFALIGLLSSAPSLCLGHREHAETRTHGLNFILRFLGCWVSPLHFQLRAVAVMGTWPYSPESGCSEPDTPDLPCRSG